VLTIREGKILTVSDFYCNPERDALLKVASLESERHGLPKYAASGLSALRFLRIKRQLSELMNQDDFWVNPMLTETQLADQMACTVDQLFAVMNVTSPADYHDYVDQHRVGHEMASNR
jgi:hypothetical protein